MFAADRSSERATSIEDYQATCVEFIRDISKDYIDWVDRYQLGEQETSRRKDQISRIVETTCEWILKYGTTIKKVDIVMNDGVNKMAESTAGYPFSLEVLVNGTSRYATHCIGKKIILNVKAMPRTGRRVRIGNYHRDQLLLVNSSSAADYSVSKESLEGADILDDYIVIDPKSCSRNDIISVTAVVEELQGDYVTESRGHSIIIILT